MTQLLIPLVGRLAHFENQIIQFEEKAHKLTSDPYSVEKIATTKCEYEKFIDQVENFELDLKNTSATNVETFKNALVLQFSSLKTNCANLREKLQRSSDASLINYKIDALFKQYHALLLSKDKERLDQMDKLQERNLQIITSTSLSPALTAAQLKQTICLHNTIEDYQRSELSNSLQKIDRLIKQAIQCPEEHRNHLVQPIKSTLDDLCFKLGLDVRKNIFEQVWIEAGRPETNAWSWGYAHAFDDLARLSKIISSQPQFSGHVTEKTPIQTNPEPNDNGDQK
ncbi:MAG TPA: hypothetical protein VLG49_01505 [Rhabdochlamydiaceae bacterium]|nr:hypothetical protein [Rhabdochlamydiaceae bacterium]